MGQLGSSDLQEDEKSTTRKAGKTCRELHPAKVLLHAAYGLTPCGTRVIIQAVGPRTGREGLRSGRQAPPDASRVAPRALRGHLRIERREPDLAEDPGRGVLPLSAGGL